MTDTAMVEAFATAGVRKDETPQKAAARIWRETKHDPVETMKRFDEWARQKPSRILEIVGQHWFGHVRRWLCGHDPITWGGSRSFTGKLYRGAKRKEADAAMTRYRESKLSQPLRVPASIHSARCSDYRRRKKAGIKVMRAEVELGTGKVVKLIDKEFGPFAHIRINGLRLPEVTTEQALVYCDRGTADVRFVRALCHLIPDPRRPIGEQWTAEMVQEAKRAAERIAA